MQGNHCASRHRHAAALVGGLLLAVLIAACADDGTKDAVPTPDATATAPLSTPTAQNGSALPLERYRYVVTLTLREQNDKASEVVITTRGRFQSPDRHALTYTVQLDEGATSRSAVLIGDDAWFRQGEESWRKISKDDPKLAELMGSAFSPNRPDFLGGPQFRQIQDSVLRLPSTEEAVNGVPANHYRVGEAGREFFEAFLTYDAILRNVDDMSWDLWLAKDGGWPVRLLATTTVVRDIKVLQELGLKAPTDWELRIDISRPNDPSLVIMVPERGT